MKQMASRNLDRPEPLNWPDYTDRARKRDLAKQLSVYLHGHETTVWRSPSGYKLIKVTRCQDCAAHQDREAVA